MAEEVENKLGQYTLLDKVAQGGMAQVYKAKTMDPTGVERLVVIKRILPHISSHPEYVEMLIDEAKIAVHFTHGNIAQVYDLGRVNDDYFIVMEYVDGKTLSQIFKALNKKNQKIPLDVLLYCMIELCHGLSYIHRKKGPGGQDLGVVHRDISPQNIILSYGGNVKIIDFGVAKADFIEGKTEDGVLKGKFAYMSPEQTKAGDLDHRSDIFSAGILLWEMATGKRLFKRETHRETVKAVQKSKYDAPSTVRSELPKELDRVVKRCLTKSPRFRYQDALNMAEDLEKILFQINPDFRPLEAAKFLYKLFGPEKDEEGLPHEFITNSEALDDQSGEEESQTSGDDHTGKTPSQALLVEEPTFREESGRNITPISRFPIKGLLSPWGKFVIMGAIIFLAGSLFTLMSHHSSKRSHLNLIGIQKDMVITLNGDQIPTHLDHEIPLLADETYTLRITQEGHKDYLEQIKLGPGEHRDIHIKLITLASTGDLLITTQPSGATIKMNGQLQPGVTPLHINNLTAGQTLTIEIQKNKYKPVERKVKIYPGREIKIHQPLLFNYAELVITSSPSGALVFLNGKEVGNTPFDVKTLIPNRNHQVNVIQNGYLPERKTLKIEAGQSEKLHFKLKPRLESDS